MRKRAMRRVLLGVLASGALVSGGCYLAPGLRPGGGQRSNDEYTYMSTPWEPLTVTLYDRRENEPLWTVDVPIGSKVSIRFYADKKGSGTAYRPDVMRWEILDAKRNYARLSNAMAVPPADSRLLRVSVRQDTPAMPDEIPAEPTLTDPDRTWVPVQPRKFRGVSAPGETTGNYYRSE